MTKDATILIVAKCESTGSGDWCYTHAGVKINDVIVNPHAYTHPYSSASGTYTDFEDGSIIRNLKSGDKLTVYCIGESHVSSGSGKVTFTVLSS